MSARAQSCARDAFLEVAKRSKATSAAKSAYKSSVKDNFWRTTGRVAIGATGTAGAAITVTLGGAPIVAGLLAASGVWTAKSIQRRLIAHKHNRALARYSKPPTPSEIRLTSAKTNAEDAYRAIRKAVVHLREAERIWQDKKKHRRRFEHFLASAGSVPRRTDYTQVADYANSAQKLRHHLFKYRLYMLPCIVQTRAIMGAFDELAVAIATERDTVEKLVTQFMEKAPHGAACSRRGRRRCCYEHATGGALTDADRKAARASDTSGGQHSRTSQTTIDTKAVRDELDKMVERYGDAIRLYRSSGEPETDANLRAWLLRKYRNRYDRPNVYKRGKHAAKNAWKKASQGERVAKVVGEVVGTGNAFGGVFLNTLITETAVKGALSAARAGTAAAITGGAAYLGNAQGAKKHLLASDLLSYDARSQVSLAGARAGARDGAIIIDQLYNKSGYHLSNATGLIKQLKKRLAKGSPQITTCHQAKLWLRRFYEIEHQLAKMERYNVAALTFLLLLDRLEGDELRDADRRITASWEDGGPIGRWLADQDGLHRAESESSSSATESPASSASTDASTAGSADGGSSSSSSSSSSSGSSSESPGYSSSSSSSSSSS